MATLSRNARTSPRPAQAPWGWALVGLLLGSVLAVLLFAIAPWLAQVRTNARALPVEVKLNRSSTPPATASAAGKGAAPAAPPVAAQPLWDGTVVLALPTR